MNDDDRRAFDRACAAHPHWTEAHKRRVAEELARLREMYERIRSHRADRTKR